MTSIFLCFILQDYKDKGVLESKGFLRRFFFKIIYLTSIEMIMRCNGASDSAVALWYPLHRFFAREAEPCELGNAKHFNVCFTE